MAQELLSCSPVSAGAPDPGAAPPNDEQLMLRLSGGDAAALRLLMERYQGPLFGYLCRLLPSRQDAEDVFQEAFLRVLRHASRFQTQRRFRPWLYAIATNLVRNAHRARSYRQTVPLDRPAGEEDGASLADLLPGRSVAPTAALEAAEAQAAVRAAVAALPEKGRTALVLYYYQGLPYAEIAEVLEVPVGTVKSRIHNAMARLGQSLDAGGQP